MHAILFEQAVHRRQAQGHDVLPVCAERHRLLHGSTLREFSSRAGTSNTHRGAQQSAVRTVATHLPQADRVFAGRNAVTLLEISLINLYDVRC